MFRRKSKQKSHKRYQKNKSTTRQNRGKYKMNNQNKNHKLKNNRHGSNKNENNTQNRIFDSTNPKKYQQERNYTNNSRNRSHIENHNQKNNRKLNNTENINPKKYQQERNYTKISHVENIKRDSQTEENSEKNDKWQEFQITKTSKPEKKSMNKQSNPQIDKLVKNYKHYQEKLLQITRQNRSVSLTRIYKKHNFDLVVAEKLKSTTLNKITLKMIENIGAVLKGEGKGKSQNILLDSIKGDDADAARSHLKTLSRNLKQIEEETGQQTGYLGFPFLCGHLNSKFYIRGPVILFPISLEYKRQARNAGWFLHFADKLPILNGALIAALKKRGECTIPDNYEDKFYDLIEDISNENSETDIFNKVNKWIQEIIQIDETKNETQTITLNQLSKDDVEELEEQSIHLVNYKIIGTFPQANTEIHRDFDELINSANLDVGIVGELINIENPEFKDEPQIKIGDTQSKKLNTILQSDSSQDEVIKESKNSDLIVVRGPPGTGKSQVIVNLISDALTNNEKILVVCQKRAALEVVRQRLRDVNLDRYVVFLEKEHDDKLKMYNQLSNIIEKEPVSPLSSDITVDEISSKIDNRIQYLSELGDALRREDFGGATAHKLYSKADGKYNPVLEINFTIPKWNELDNYISKIKDLEIKFKKFENKDHPWFGRVNFADFDLLRKKKLSGKLSKLIKLTPECILANNSNDQSELPSLFDTYMNNPGFLKLNRTKSANKINRILGVKVNDEFVSENFEKVKNGENFWNIFTDILSMFNAEKQKELESIVSDTKYLTEYLSNLHNTFEEFEDMQYLDSEKKNDQDVFLMLNQAKIHFDSTDNWAERIRQEIYFYWLNIIEHNNPILKEPISNYSTNKQDLARLLEEKHEIVKRKIQRDIESTVSQSDLYGRDKTSSQKEWRDLTAELKKKRKVKPVRKLLEKYASKMFQIAPCWLASPESVSKTFPLEKGIFDLVIVDEASQLPLERSIPFLYRAKRVVVAGDEHQLQPFDLFQIKHDDSEDEDISDEKSLLDFANSKYKTITLNWHYRSKYQDLIDFSNHAFYEGVLNVAPNAINRPDAPPIQWIKCNGIWEDKHNVVEAERVVDEISEIYNSSQELPSIGVITFNEKQQDFIKDIIDKRREEDPNFLNFHDAKQDDKLFVKNIENVQGDERDIIIFSIGYAKDADGNFTNHFGTLTFKGGENRLNVAITRAREKMIVISSIESTEIKSTLNKGPKLLKKFLEYAKMTNSSDKRGQENVLSEINPDMKRTHESDVQRFDSDFEKQVYKKLKESGCKVDTQIGYSGYRIDLGIVHPNDENSYILGIECDGATFHSTKSVKERDVMRQKFLEENGWTIERIWSRNWWNNPEREVKRINARIDALVDNKCC